jgi:predicted metal-dependent hydrolase
VSARPPEPELGAEERRLYAQGIDEFNAGLFFECHETLEDLWTGVRGPSRDFFQGLIQIAVALYHLTRGNLAGAESLFGRALKRLEKYPDRYGGIDLGTLRADARRWRERTAAGGLAEPAVSELPKIAPPA